MRRNLLSKILVVLIIILPVFSYSGCKKQAKCGCGKDVLFTLTKEPSIVYFNETGTYVTFQVYGNSYDTYNFCNPGEMFPKFTGFKSGDLLLVTGSAYWDCSYLYQNSNYSSSYQSYYKVYQVQVTDVEKSPYGKK